MGLWLVFALVAAAGLALDQITKAIALDRLDGEPPVEVVGELLQLNLTHNPGAAFSTGTELTPYITCLAIVATGVVLWISRRVGSLLWAIGLGLLLAGITGNLMDRLIQPPSAFHGHVIDFLMLPNWPVFNVADMCITAGVIAIILQAFRGVGIDGTREHTTGEVAE